MKLISKSSFWLLLLACSSSYGQMEQYNYTRELKGINANWHKVVLPDEVFGKVTHDLSDIRIFGVTAGKDTIEAPYLLRRSTEKVTRVEVNFKTVNISHNTDGYYYTFEVPTNEAINQIELDFKQANFDWRIALEGSQDQQEWFTLIENYRILSIDNGLTKFQFTKVSFPDSRYRFFRLLVKSREKPSLTLAEISQYEIIEGTFREYSIMKSNTNENHKARQTEIEIELPLPVPVSHIKIGVNDTFDYYRPVTIKYLSDSFKTEKGWKYRYNTLTSGTLNSLEENEFKFNSTILKKVKIIIDNHDNQPLTFGNVEVKGVVHELVGRFTTPATYFLTYGSSNAGKPRYDIKRFADKIPEEISTIELEGEQIIGHGGVPAREPLFKNKTWLWGIMILIIGILGWFTGKMIKKNE